MIGTIRMLLMHFHSKMIMKGFLMMIERSGKAAYKQ